MGQFGTGQGLRRIEDVRLLTGQGCYSEDVQAAGALHAVFLRSPLAHARIKGIDSTDASRIPGVRAVFTNADLSEAGVGHIPCIALMKGKDGKPTVQPPYPALAQDRVRFVGQPIAMVVAETLAAARDALDLIDLDLEELPAVVDAADAAAEGAPQIWSEAPGNLCLDWEHGNAEATEQAFAKAAHVTRLDIVNNRVVVNSLEPRAALASYDSENSTFTLHSGSQGVFRQRMILARILGIEEDQLRVVTTDVGGGFGMKIFVYPEQVALLFAARALGGSVRWTSERSEAFLSDTQGRDHRTQVELALDAEGRFLGLHVRTYANLGAYLSNFAPYIPTGASTQMLSGLYRIPAIHAEVKCVFTNTVPVDAYRGAGRPEAAYLMERVVDAAARELGLSPRELRLKNFITGADLPYETGMGPIYDSGNYARLMEEATRRADWEGAVKRKREARARGKLLGIGLASYVEACAGIGTEEARLRLDADGGVTLFVGTMTNGQGHATAYAQILNDRLGIDPQKVRLRQGDTNDLGSGGGTGGSRSLLMGGMALDGAATKVIERARRVASHLLEAAEGDIEQTADIFAVVGTDRRVTLAEIAQAVAGGTLPDDLSRPIDETANYKAPAMTYPNGCHVVEVEVDEETGEVEILRYVVADDFGRIVNPLLAAGQVHGGIAQGIGQALLERTVYDRETGQLLSGSLMDYCLPRADDLPAFEVELIEDMPCTTNPLGVKGAGEAGAIGAPPALINAIIDALSPYGVRHVDMPATPERIWSALKTAKAAV